MSIIRKGAKYKIMGHTVIVTDVKKHPFGNIISANCYDALCCTVPLTFKVECSLKDFKKLTDIKG